MLRASRTRTYLLLSTLAALFLFVFPLAASAQYTQTQEVELRRGWNEITLQVQPEDLRFEAILEDVLEHVVIVENEVGEKYVPADDINQITEWDLDEAYRIHMEEGATLAVEGEPYVSTAQVNLTTGWNLLPFYLNSPVAAKTVMEQMGSGVSALREGVAGHMYNPANDQTELEVLEPGHGYYVLAERDARVRPINDLPAPGLPQDPGIPGDPNAPGDPGDDEGGDDSGETGGDDNDPFLPSEPEIPADADHVFNTMAEMLAHRGFAVGQTVAVRGYYEPGDNGGGVFDVTDNGCAPDGATCYVPEEHQAESVPATIKNNFSSSLAHENIVFGSVRLYYNETEYLTDLQLHGHQMHLKGAPPTMIDHGQGRLSLTNEIRHLPNDRGNGRWTLEYRYATEPIRLARRDVEYIHIRWLGARPSADFDATDHIGWAINGAARLHERTGELGDMVVDDMYYYAGQIIHRDGVRLRGEREGVREGQGFRVLDDSAIQYFREMRLPKDHTLWLPRSVRSYYQNEFTIWIRPQPNARFVAVKDFQLDGNVDGNMSLFDHANEFGSTNPHFPNEVDHLLQNTQYWNAYATGSGASHDLHVLLDNIHFHDYGGNIINTQGEPYFDGSKRIKVGNSVRNHAFYDVRTRNGWISDIEVYGYSFGAPFIVYDGRFRGLVIKDLVQKTPSSREVDYPIQIRGIDWARLEAPEMRGVYIEDFEIDADGLDYGGIVYMAGKHLHMNNGVVRTRHDGSTSFFYLRGGSGGADVKVTNVNIEHRSSGTFGIMPHRAPFKSLYMSNINIQAVRDGVRDYPILISPRRVNGKQTFVFHDITTNYDTQYLFQLDEAQEGSEGLDVYILGTVSKFDHLVRYPERSNGLVKYYFSDCTIDPAALTNQDRQVSHFVACSDTEGRSSTEWNPPVNNWPSDLRVPVL